MTGRHAAPDAGPRARSPVWGRLAAGSMAPTLDDGETVLVLRWPLSVDRWDVVVATPPGPDAEPVVKRVVALGGESVAIEDGALVVDGATVCEPWSDPARLDGVWFGPVRIRRAPSSC